MGAPLLGRYRQLLRGGLLVAMAVCLCVACGSAGTTGPGGAGATGGGASLGSAGSPFVYRGPTEGHPRNCTAAQDAARLPPIVYRPSWLSTARKVPLVIGLHSSFGTPQSMQGVSHFEELANADGFVVAYPGSCNDPHPWGSTQDFTYLKSLIPQLIASQNIDPKRVYVAGYSAGGYASWLLGCRLSSEVTAVAIVANAMSGRLYTSCSPVRPVSELLMVGTADGTRYTGVPGRAPSPFQTTARWRALDGCTVQPVSTSAPVPAVSQQTWSSCTDGSAVSLVLVQGAQHGWPPYAVGAPAGYRASLTVWAFLSAHTGAPLALSTSDAKLLSLRATSGASGRTRFDATLRVSEPVTIVATLGRSQTPRRTIYLTRLGPRTVTVSFSLPVGARPSYRVVLRLRDSYGRTRRITRSVTGG